MAILDDINALSLQQIEVFNNSGSDIAIVAIGSPTLNSTEQQEVDDLITALEAKSTSDINDLVGPTHRARRVDL